MGTKIDYLDEAWSVISGCSGKGCKARCWAREMVKRFPAIHGWDENMEPIPFSTVQLHHDRLDKPLHWRKPRRVGVCFMGDLFDEQVPDDWIIKVIDVMEIEATHHTYFVLTKQPNRMANFMRGYHEIDNIFWGVSITEQEDADRMIPELLKVPGRKWVSVEPILGPVDLEGLLSWACPQCNSLNPQIIWPCPQCHGNRYEQIDWIVLGCESGSKRRPCPHEWMIDVVEQCNAANVPVWVKQVDMGNRVSHNPEEWPEELRIREK